MGRGLARTAVAELLGISTATANDSLKYVYVKLDILRQREVVRIIERLAVLTSRHED